MSGVGTISVKVLYTMPTIDISWLNQHFPELTNLLPLATGGQKSVLKANDSDGSPVVLKIFHLGSDQERVERELGAVQSIKSDRIPKILRYGSISSPLGSILWFVEQCILGESLHSVLARQSLSNLEILKLGMHLLEALSAAEACKIVHRDVKPLNIMMDVSGDFWLIDFGLARHLELTSLTPTSFNRGAGSLGYSPPEQFQNKKGDIDGQTDLFSAGVVLYQCSEGVNPFLLNARSDSEVFRRMERTQLPKINRQIDTSGQFAELVLAMTRKNRVLRPASVQEALAWMNEVYQKENLA